MKLKILVPGVLILVVGILFLTFPGVAGQLESGLGLTPSPTQSLYLVKVSPGNYSYVTYTLQPADQLSVTISAGPQAVDFFLMNGGNFSSWANTSTTPSQVYPQSAFNVKNYTFSFAGQGRTQGYYLVFEARSTTSATDVLVRSSVQDSSNSVASTVPAAFVGIGIVLALIGVRVGGGKDKERPEGLQERSGTKASAATTHTCRYCGAQTEDDSRFCRSCGRSLG